jgi:hypothetical protein
MNDVFEALRQEERIQSIAEFVEGEMIIDASRLGLLVSEVIPLFLSSMLRSLYRPIQGQRACP